MRTKALHHLLSLTIPLLTLGCASSKTTGLKEVTILSPDSYPQKITIAHFKEITKHPNPHLNTKYLDPNSNLIYVGEIGNTPQTNNVGNALSSAIRSQVIKESHIPTEVSKIAPKTGLWLVGQMTAENQGSRALRSLVGLGLGRTRLETRTYVYNVDKSTKTPWLTIWNKAQSGREPGALFSALPSPIPIFNILGAASVAAIVTHHSRNGLTEDAKRTGKTLAKEMLAKINKDQY